MDTILGYLTSFTGGLFDVAGETITFIMEPTHAICLIPVVAWICYMGVGLVRSLYKG